tara:strand:- start:2710 stop:3582 length:873 start_codon:yes stop_codon:yes gene_type:complete
MFKKKFRIYLFLLIPFLLNSCSIAGSWVYERIDSYLADYFIEFADFNQIQKQEINKTSKEFHDWFSESELPKIKGLLLELKNIDPNNPKREISLAYEMGELIFARANGYFEEPIIQFTKGITDKQIDQMKQHFETIRKEREEERKKEKKNYKQRISENFVSGFNRVGIKLDDSQLMLIDGKLNNYAEVREEWSNLQKIWIDEFIDLLRQKDADEYSTKMLNYLRSLENLGSSEFRDKIESNEKLSLEIINATFMTLNEKQLKSFKRNMDIYIKSINRILSNRGINTDPIG